MNNYVSTEKSLKRWLKNKVKVTMATVVGFLIAGTVVFAADVTVETIEVNKETTIDGSTGGRKPKDIITGINANKNKEGQDYINDKSIKITHDNIAEEKWVAGIFANNGGNVNLSGENIDINVNGKSTVKGVVARSEGEKGNSAADIIGGKITLGGNNTKNINITVHSDGDFVSALEAHRREGSKTDISTIEVNSENLNITASSNWEGLEDDNGAVYAIFAQGTGAKGDKGIAKITINSENTIINATAIGTYADSFGIVALSNSSVEINGNLEINADKIIATRGYSEIKINESSNKNVKLTGDIDFNYDKPTSGTPVDANVLINLSNKDSYFNGKIIVTGTGIPEGYSKVSDMTLGLSNGGTWNITGDSFINNLTLDGGIIKEYKTSENQPEITADKTVELKIFNNDGFQMSNGSTLEGNLVISAVVNDGKDTLAEKTLTIAGEGNTLALGDSSSIKGNILVNSGAELTNKGTLNLLEGTLTNQGTINLETGKTITLADGSSLLNEKGAIINVASGATAVTGGTAENKGTISLADTTTSETDKNISMLLNGGEMKNSGTITLADRTTGMTDENWETLLGELAKGTFTNTGMVVDQAGNSIFSDGSIIDSGSVGEIAEGTANDEAIKIDKDGVTITGSGSENNPDKLEDKVINVEGNLELAKGNNEAGVVMDNVTMNVENEKIVTVTEGEHSLSGNINLNGSGKIDVQQNAGLILSGAVSQGADTGAVIENNGTLNLDNVEINVAITGDTGTVNSAGITSIGNITAKDFNVAGTEEETATTYVDGEIAVTNITVGKETVSTFALRNNQPLNDTVDKLVLSSDSKFTNSTGTTLIINKDGEVLLGIGSKTENGNKYTENAFNNSEIAVKVDGDGKIVLDTSNISGKEAVIVLGKEHTFVDGGFESDSIIYTAGNTVTDGELVLSYNTKLYDNAVLNEINNAAAVLAGGTFNDSDLDVRAAQLDKIYSENIYSETVRAAYDSLKMSEEAVLSLAHEVKAGEFKADGKALYSKDEYTKDGSIGSYDAEVESTGLLASLEYGLSDTATAGVVFSGVKQDVDTDGGSADADLFYLGVFGTKAVGNYDFTAGLGYQFGEYEADNNIANIAGSDKYDSTAFSGYVQGRYTADLGDGLSVQPKVKLGYTYLEQDDAKDSYFGVSDAEISTFDAEFGLDVVKSVQFEKSRLDVKFGASYVRTMGDTDEMFKGHFYGNGTSSFDVIGAELAENVVKFNLGAESVQENGFFYNGGFTYEFGSNDTEAYGVNLGVGYKF